MIMEMPPESPQKNETLAAIGHRIYGSFHLLETAARSHEDGESFSSALENQSQRFGLWAKSLGLYDLGHSSLDYRFRDAPTVHQHARKLLDDLEKSIYESMSAILSPLPGPSPWFIYISVHARTRAEILLVQQDVDWPNSGWAIAAEQPPRPMHAANRIAAVDADFDMNQGDDESSEDEETLMSYQEESISSIVLGNIKLTIDRLYKLAFQVRNPATRMGLSKARDYREIDQDTGVDVMDFYASLDLKHMAEIAKQFWGKSQEECESHYLIQRLARANTHRRRQFGQWRRHKLKQDNAEKAITLTLENKPTAQLPAKSTNSAQSSEKKIISLPSTATKLDEDMVNLIDTSSVITSSTYTIAFKEDYETAISIPPLPKKHCSGEAFECPYCYILCSKRVSKAMAWE